MAYVDNAVSRFVRARFFDTLNALDPETRAAESLRLKLEALRIEVSRDDELVGRFFFDAPDSEPEFRYYDGEEPTAEENTAISAPNPFGCNVKVDRAHTCLDYGRILSEGLNGYLARLSAALQSDPENRTLLAMRSAADAVSAFCRRLRQTVEDALFYCKERDRRHLILLREALSRVPFEPAVTLREALQSVWIIHFITPLAEDAWYSISLGRMDRWLLPYYRRHLQNGGKKSEAKTLLRAFYTLLNTYADGACLLNVGPDYNALSRLLIECQKEFAMPAPILGARIAKTTPAKIWDTLIDESLFAMGQPTFYSEEGCAAALEEKGLNAETAAGFSNNSCMGFGIAGAEVNSMWGCVFKVPAALDAAMRGGRVRIAGNDVFIPGIRKPASFEDLVAEFTKAASYLLSLCGKAYMAAASYSERTIPDPFTSLLTEGCIARGCDRISGAEYHNVTVECFGMQNVADALCAIDELVYRQYRFSLDEIAEACDRNFEGYTELRRELAACPKYGQNGPADAYIKRVAGILQGIIRSLSCGRFYFMPSLHTLDANVGAGAGWIATADGRLAGQPFAKNAGPMNNVRGADPTSLVLSAVQIPQTKFYGGQPIDVNFSLTAVRDHKDTIRSLISYYLKNGGLQFQVNALDAAVLRKAKADPEAYPDLVVRIGGYSTYFSSLSDASKNELIERVTRESL